MPVEFWNQQFSQELEREPLGGHSPLARALEHFGDVSGRSIIDLGCGEGVASRFFAAQGARVLAVDTSDVALEHLSHWCRDHGVRTIECHRMSAFDIEQLGPQDLVFGSMILHHLEPFSEFARSLRSVLVPNGRGYFYENNGASRTLLWCRRHVVGHFGIPKYGDDEEFPLTPDEVDELRRYFTVQQSFPQFLYFELATTYLTRGHLQRTARRTDQRLERWPSIQKYSYRQELRLS